MKTQRLGTHLVQPPPDFHQKPSARKGTRAISWLLGIVIVILVIVYGQQLKEALLKVNLLWVMAGMACYGVNYGLRGLRWQLLTRGAIRWWPQGVHASCVHGFASYMLPFRTGELILPLILRNLAGLSLSQGSRALIRARLLDIHTLGLWVIVVALGTGFTHSASLRIGWFFLGLGMFCAPVIFGWLARSGGRMPYAPVKKLSALIDRQPLRLGEWLVSLAIWCAVAIVFYCTAKAIGLYIDLRQVWLLITLQLPLQLIPFQGVANSGNHESGWVAGLVLLGFATGEAIEFALLSHLVLLVYVLALGPVGLLTGPICPRRVQDAVE